METKRPKIKARATPAAARILKALMDYRGLAVMWNGRGAQWRGVAWPIVKRQLGNPKMSTIRRMVNEGWLENLDGSDIDWTWSDAGRLALEEFGELPVPEIRMTAQDLIRALQGWYKLTHVIATEITVIYDQKRRIDALAIPILSGAASIAFELKVEDRGDFLSELKDPRKRNAAMEIAQYFIFVTIPGVADVSEIPLECGLLLWNGRTFNTEIDAQWLGKNPPSWELVAAIAKRLTAKRHTYSV